MGRSRRSWSVLRSGWKGAQGTAPCYRERLPRRGASGHGSRRLPGLARPLHRCLAPPRSGRHRRPVQRRRALRLRPVRRGRDGRAAVVAAWLADPDEPGSWEADYEVLAIDGDACVAHGRTRYLTDDRNGGRPRVRERLRLPLRRRGPLPRVHRVVHAPPPGGHPGLSRGRLPARSGRCTLLLRHPIEPTPAR